MTTTHTVTQPPVPLTLQLTSRRSGAAPEYRINGLVFDVSSLSEIPIVASRSSMRVPPSTRRVPASEVKRQDSPPQPLRPETKRHDSPQPRPETRRYDSPPQPLRAETRRTVAMPPITGNTIPHDIPRISSIRLGTGTKYTTVREYKLAMTVLRHNFPTLEIPEIKDDDDLKLVDAVYDALNRKGKRINITRAIRLGVVVIIVTMELIATHVCGLRNARTFLDSQLRHLDFYDPYIEEFCEKYKLDREREEGVSESWPLEIRFTLSLLTHFTLFLAVRTATDSTDILSLLSKIGKSGIMNVGAAAANVVGGGGNVGGDGSILGTVSSLFGGFGSLMSTVMAFLGPQQAATTGPLPEPVLNTPVYED